MIQEYYFDWLISRICGGRHGPEISYRKMLSKLHDTEFVWLMPRDKNRSEDGKALRRRFAGLEDACELDGPCSVLEMMYALAVRCEEDLMHDPAYGDRTQQWFWRMIVCLGLGGMRDEFYDEAKIEECVHRLLYRNYSEDGTGGLFIVRNCPHDLRSLEIWDQMCWYINSIT